MKKEDVIAELEKYPNEKEITLSDWKKIFAKDVTFKYKTGRPHFLYLC